MNATTKAKAQIKEAQRIVAPYRKLVNENPPLLSVLYDIDLMPEQIVNIVNAARLVALCEMFKRLTPEAITDLFSLEQTAKVTTLKPDQVTEP